MVDKTLLTDWTVVQLMEEAENYRNKKRETETPDTSACPKTFVCIMCGRFTPLSGDQLSYCLSTKYRMKGHISLSGSR